MLVGQSGLFNRASLAALDSVEDWISADKKDSMLKLSFKVLGILHLFYQETVTDPSSPIAESRRLCCWA